MSKSSLHMLTWSEEHHCYDLTTRGHFQRTFAPEDTREWPAWLEEHTAFAFEGQTGHLSVIKEVRARASYWYAYRRRAGRTHKRYLGHSDQLSFSRLEETALILTNPHSSRQVPQADFKPAQQRATFQQKEPMKRAPVAPAFASIPLLAPKLQLPRLPALLVERPRLLLLLERGQKQKLTLVQAPAGSGKTTLVRQWLASRQRPAEASQSMTEPVAWISLDRGDNDPVRFWSTMITACQTIYPFVGKEALSLLFQPFRLSFSPSPLQTALTSLLNDLASESSAGILILEDYHLIEHPRLHEALAFFIEHLPTSLHLLILTRNEPPLPLMRWRARGEVLDIQGGHLRFSVEETALFLQQVLLKPLSQEVVRMLHAHLEGWAAGLRLLTLSIQGQETPQRVESTLAQLSMGSPFDHAHRPIQEYFLSEVFNAQSEPLQLFLLQTSILGHFTGSLCDVVTGRTDSTAWLAQAQRSGFFLEATESTGQWYRYHALFAEILRAEAIRRLGKDALCHLSAKASRWYEAHGMLVEAIESALAARKFERVALLIEKLNEHVYFSEHHTMQRWLEQLPISLLHTHPALCFLFAQAKFFSEEGKGSIWRLEPVDDLLQMAEEGWRECGDMFQLGILSAFRATFTIVHGLIARAVVYARQALQLLPPAAERPYASPNRQPPEWIEWHCGCLITLGMEAMQAGLFNTAHHHVLEAYTLSQGSEDRVFARVSGNLLGDICLEMGEFHQASSYYQRALAESPILDESGDDLLRAGSISGLLHLAYERNKLDQAEQLIREASLHNYRGNFLYGEGYAHMKVELFRLLVLSTRGEADKVQASLSALQVQLRTFPDTHPLLLDVLIWQTRLQIRAGDLSGASRTLNMLMCQEQELSQAQQNTMHLLQARLLLARGETAAALPLLAQLLASAQHGKHLYRALEIRLLIALAHIAHKQEHEARQQLYEVLSQARHEGFLRLFLDEGEPLAALLRAIVPSFTEKPLRSYTLQILHAFPAWQASHSANQNMVESSLLEPLSAQEQRVLTLLVAGRSNPEIAQTLIISVNTVKGHVKNLYRKLGVTNRVEASEVARREQLL